MRVILVWCISILMTTCAWANQEFDNEKEIFKTTLSYLIETDRLNDAGVSVGKYLKRYPQDSEALRLDGLVYYLKKDYKNSSTVFLFAAQATQNQEKAINLYLAAQSNIKQGEFKSAEEILKQMSEIPSTKDYSELALIEFEKNKNILELGVSMLLSKKEEVVLEKSTNVIPSKKKVFNFLLTPVIGSDSNPTFVPDNSDAKKSASSPFYSLTAMGGHNSKFYDGEMVNDLTLGYTNYQKEEAKVFNNLRFNLSTKWAPEQSFFHEYKLSLSNKLDRSYMTNKGIKYYFTGNTLIFSKEFTPMGDHKFNTSLLLGYRTYGNQDLIAVENDRSGVSYGTRGIHKMARDEWAWLNSLTYLNQNTTGKKFNTKNLEFVTSYQRVTLYDLECVVSGSYSIANYHRFTQSRTDKTLGLGIDLSHDLPWDKGLNVKLSYSHNKNSSPVSEFSYTQDVISLWVIYDVL